MYSFSLFKYELEVHTKKILVQSFALLIRSVLESFYRLYKILCGSEVSYTLTRIVTEGRLEIRSLKKWFWLEGAETSTETHSRVDHWRADPLQENMKGAGNR